MERAWCPACCTPHGRNEDCPGELLVVQPERHGWRVNVETSRGLEAFGVLVAPTYDGTWRARILTYPNVLWLVPGGSNTLKFAAGSAVAAERQAIDFIREHCHSRGLLMRNEVAVVQPAGIAPEVGDDPNPPPAPRKIRFLPLRFGVVNAFEPGGTGNLSETGLFIITNFPLDEGVRLRMLLDLSDQQLPLIGNVRWMNSAPHVGRSPGMGVHLHLPSAQYRDFVRGLA